MRMFFGREKPTWTNRLPRLRGYDIGDFTYGVPIVHDWTGKSRLTIGRFCSIAGGVHFFLDGDHPITWTSTYPFTQIPGLSLCQMDFIRTKGDIRIGHDVWLGHECVILSGVTIGNGAVIGARAVISSNVPAYGIAVGNPGRVIKYRFDEKTRIALEALCWWDWSLEKIKAELPYMMDDRLTEFLRRHQSQ